MDSILDSNASKWKIEFKSGPIITKQNKKNYPPGTANHSFNDLNINPVVLWTKYFNRKLKMVWNVVHHIVMDINVWITSGINGFYV